MGRFFSGPVIDEVALRESVRPAVRALAGALPDRDALRQRTASHGIDIATALLHEAILASPNGDFVRRVDARPPAVSLRMPHVCVLVVPTLFYREHPEIGGDGGLVVAAARRLGLTAQTAPVGSLASVEANARAIVDCVDRIVEDEVWIVTLSKGALELKHALALPDGSRALAKVRVWVNIAGVLGGSPIVDRMARTALRRLFIRTYLAARGGTGDALFQMARTHAIARAPLMPLPQIDVVNVVPLPLPSHLPRETLRSFERLQSEGPNDGFVAFWDAVAPGSIYPVWSCDHYLRTPRLSLLVYQLFGELAERRETRSVLAVGGRG